MFPADAQDYIRELRDNGRQLCQFNDIIEVPSMSDKIQDTEISRGAFETLMKYSGTLSEDFDYRAELEVARAEKIVIHK